MKIRLILLGLVMALFGSVLSAGAAMASAKPLPLTIYNGVNYAKAKPAKIMHLGGRHITGLHWSSYGQVKGIGHGTIHASGHAYPVTVRVSQAGNAFSMRVFENLRTDYKTASGIHKVQFWTPDASGDYRQVEQNPALARRVMEDCFAKDVKAEKDHGIVNHKVTVVIKGTANVWCTTPPNEFRLRMKIMRRHGNDKTFHEVAESKVYRTAPNKFGKTYEIEHVCVPGWVYITRLVVWGVSDQGTINPPANVDSKHLRVVKCVAGHGGGR